MIEPLHFSYPSQYCNIFYVSCLHFGHDRDFIYKPRGFTSVQEHDDTLVKRWNDSISNRDIVHSIGDTIFGQGSEKRLMEYFRKLNFWKLYLSPGNHFSGWHQLYKKVLNEKYRSLGLPDNTEIYPLEYTLYEGKTIYFMPNLYEIYVGKQAMVLCHYPIASWHGQGKGSYLICGHTHRNYPPTRPESTNGKMLDVCVENFGKPVSYSEVEKIMNTKSILVVDHHGDK